VEIFTVQDFKKKESYVVKRGEIFSHGETVEKVVEGLRYKLSDRDTTKFKNIPVTKNISLDEAIQAYRAITGACEFGVKSFVESMKIPEPLTIKSVVDITVGHWGHDQFKEFFIKAD
jgi:hypothetical protein